MGQNQSGAAGNAVWNAQLGERQVQGDRLVEAIPGLHAGIERKAGQVHRFRGQVLFGIVKQLLAGHQLGREAARLVKRVLLAADRDPFDWCHTKGGLPGSRAIGPNAIVRAAAQPAGSDNSLHMRPNQDSPQHETRRDHEDHDRDEPFFSSRDRFYRDRCADWLSKNRLAASGTKTRGRLKRFAAVTTIFHHPGSPSSGSCGRENQIPSPDDRGGIRQLSDSFDQALLRSYQITK